MVIEDVRSLYMVERSIDRGSAGSVVSRRVARSVAPENWALLREAKKGQFSGSVLNDTYSRIRTTEEAAGQEDDPRAKQRLLNQAEGLKKLVVMGIDSLGH